MFKVGVNGYGTIGKRVADAIVKNPRFQLVGIVKYTPDYSSRIAFKKGINIYVPAEKWSDFESQGIKPKGTIQEFLEESSIIVDASPNGKGAANLPMYKAAGKPAIFQGGEKPEVAELSFSAYCNYDDAVGRKYLRVVSCNTTGILRILCVLHREFTVKRAKVLVIRRGADPKEDARGPINSIKLESIGDVSHHGKDAMLVLPDVKIISQAVVVPTTLMHVQYLDIDLGQPVTKSQVIEALSRYARILLVDPGKTGLDSTSKLTEAARDLLRSRNDIYENIVFENTVIVSENNVSLLQAIHQESIVVPENVDALYAVANIKIPFEKVVEETDRLLGIGGLKDVF
uniref:Glyceraldehyde-3-phosphate dehydrogenase n=1 Tax=Thermosphaera aggregans TaxID=54254 RepID=A0A7C2FH46_9CREN